MTLREFQLQRDVTAQLAARVEAMDTQGTRGESGAQVQMTELIKDVSELSTSVKTWQAAHEQQHINAETQRQAGRRWLIGTAIAGLGLLVAMAAMVATLLVHTVP